MKTWLAACVLAILLAAPSVASACPFCKAATESNQAAGIDDAEMPGGDEPKSYMVSILFMLALPTTAAAVGGVVLWRLSRQDDGHRLAADHPVFTQSVEAAG